MKRIRILETRGVGRLGRHVLHDPWSRSFEVTPRSNTLRSQLWKRYLPPFNQGNVGSCTGNALTGVFVTEPFVSNPGLLAWLKAHQAKINEAFAVRLYSAATHFDDIDGVYPPNDVGSSGLAVCKAAKKMGLIGGYRHAFSMHAALLALANDGPIIIGINWYEGFDKSRGTTGLLEIGGDVRGGHELEVNQIDVERRLIRGPNSWGTEVGDHGFYTMSFDTLDQLLDENGDATSPRPL